MAKSESIDKLNNSIDKLEVLSRELSIKKENESPDDPIKKRKLKLKASFAQQWKQGSIISFKMFAFYFGVILFPAYILMGIDEIIHKRLELSWHPVISIALILLYIIGVPIFAYRIGFQAQVEIREALDFKHELQPNSEDDECPTTKN